MFVSEDIGEPGSEEDSRLPFVGRCREREEIKTYLKKRKHRIVQVCGAPCIGKEKLVQQICEELIQESKKHDDCTLEVTSVSCKHVDSWENFLERLVNALPNNETEKDYHSSKPIEYRILNIIQVYSNSSQGNHLILSFTKLDNILFNENRNQIFNQFCELCNKILKSFRKTFILLSSQIRLRLDMQYIVRSLTLTKLTELEAVSLLHKAALDVDFGGCEKDIARGCCCVPGLLLEAASILGHPDSIVKPESLADLLQSPDKALEFFSSDLGPKEEHLRCKIQNLLQRLPEHLQSSVNDLMLLQGSFSTEAIEAVLGQKKSETAVQTIPALRDSAVLEFDKAAHTFSINPLFRAHLNEDPGSSSSDLARLRFVKFFADVMATIDQKLYKDSHKSAMEYFHYDYGNVQQLMQQAMHCTEDIFSALMKAVSEAEELFIKCFPVEKVKDFYQHLLKAAEKFGKPQEIGIIKMFLAQAMTQMKVDEHRKEVADLFQEAYKSLPWDQPGYHHMMLLGFVGRFINRQGKYRKGLKFIQAALNMKIDVESNTRIYRRIIEFLVQKALAEVFKEDYELAEQTLNDALDIAQKEAPYHSAVAVIFNTFGLIMDRSGRNEDRALEYYNSSLSERRKYSYIVPEILVAPLNNIANQSLKRGNIGYAKKLTEEALDIRRKCGWNDYYTGLTLRQLAEIDFVEGKYDLAIERCNEAFKICQECTPRHFFLNEIRLLRFHVHLASNDLSNATEVYHEMLADRDRYARDTVRGVQTMNVLFHSLLMKEGDEWDNAYNEVQLEIRRLRDLAFQHEDFDKYVYYSEKVNNFARLFTSRRLDQDEVHKLKCQSLVIENCKLCSLQRSG